MGLSPNGLLLQFFGVPFKKLHTHTMFLFRGYHYLTHSVYFIYLLSIFLLETEAPGGQGFRPAAHCSSRKALKYLLS